MFEEPKASRMFIRRTSLLLVCITKIPNIPFWTNTFRNLLPMPVCSCHWFEALLSISIKLSITQNRIPCSLQPYSIVPISVSMSRSSFSTLNKNRFPLNFFDILSSAFSFTNQSAIFVSFPLVSWNGIISNSPFFAFCWNNNCLYVFKLCSPANTPTL